MSGHELVNAIQIIFLIFLMGSHVLIDKISSLLVEILPVASKSQPTLDFSQVGLSPPSWIVGQVRLTPKWKSQPQVVTSFLGKSGHHYRQQYSLDSAGDNT